MDDSINQCPACGCPDCEPTSECPNCGTMKCERCDMGNDVECAMCTSTYDYLEEVEDYLE